MLLPCPFTPDQTGEYFFQPLEPAQQLLLSHQLAGSIFLISLQLVDKMATGTVPHTRRDSWLGHCRNKRTPTRCTLPAWVIPQSFPVLWGTFPSPLDTAKSLRLAHQASIMEHDWQHLWVHRFGFFVCVP